MVNTALASEHLGPRRPLISLAMPPNCGGSRRHCTRPRGLGKQAEEKEMLWIRLLYKLTRKYFGFSPILPPSFSIKKKRVRLQAVWGLQRPSCSQPLPCAPKEAGGRRGQAQGRGGALGPSVGWGPLPGSPCPAVSPGPLSVGLQGGRHG